MHSNFSVYTRNPFPNAPEFRHMKTLQRGAQIEDESETSRRVRRRLYQKREGIAVTQRPKQLTKAQKQKITTLRSALDNAAASVKHTLGR